jgi:hypothetical protein
MENTNLEITELEEISLLNNLIDVLNEKETVWKFHPNNPDGIDIIEYYNKLEEGENDIKNQIKNL